MAAQLKLVPTFIRKLAKDGFKRIGYYEIQVDNDFKIHLVDNEAGNWKFSVYSFVSYADGGKHVRIGKYEGPLSRRLNEYSRLTGDALNTSMPKNQEFKGGTPPWEAIEYTVPYHRRGLLFARRVETLATVTETKKVLRDLERQLQNSYDPPLCNDIAGGAGHKLRDAWVKKHGKPTVIKKRVVEG